MKDAIITTTAGALVQDDLMTFLQQSMTCLWKSEAFVRDSFYWKYSLIITTANAFKMQSSFSKKIIRASFRWTMKIKQSEKRWEDLKKEQIKNKNGEAAGE